VKSEDKYNKESGLDIAGDTIKTVFMQNLKRYHDRESDIL